MAVASEQHREQDQGIITRTLDRTGCNNRSVRIRKVFELGGLKDPVNLIGQRTSRPAAIKEAAKRAVDEDKAATR